MLSASGSAEHNLQLYNAHFDCLSTMSFSKTVCVAKIYGATSAGGALVVSIWRGRVVCIGRRPAVDDPRVTGVVLEDARVSSAHCYVWCVEFDATTPPVCYLQDASTNHTYVDGRAVTRGECVILEDGAEVEIRGCFRGSVEIRGWSGGNRALHPVSQIYHAPWIISPTVLGSGSFGTVQIATKEGSHELYAVKVARGGVLSTASRMEAVLLEQLAHPNVVRVHATLSGANFLAIVQDLAVGGDLFSYLSMGGDFLQGLSEGEAILALYQIGSALGFLHSRGVVHRDVKLDNVLVMDIPVRTPRLVLADFGVAKQLWPLEPQQPESHGVNNNFETRGCGKVRVQENGRNGTIDRGSTTRASHGYMRPLLMTTIVGTAEYAAPEINLLAKKTHPYSEKVDAWSLGVLAHIILTGQSPFYAEKLETTVERVQRGALNLNSPRWANVSTHAKTFVTRCLDRNEANRWSLAECMAAPLFNAGQRPAIIARFLAKKGIANTSAS